MPEERLLKFRNNMILPSSCQQKLPWSVGFIKD